MDTIKTFKNKGYIFVRNLVNTHKLYQYTLKNKKNGEIDTRFPFALSFYRDKEMNKLQNELLPIISELTGYELFKTYNYLRIYSKGAILRIHRDRPACEISVTLNLGQKGPSWPIWLVDYDENARSVSMQPGDALIYHGCDLFHWRGKLTKSDDVSQVFFHYVDKNGPNAWCKNDTIRIKPEDLPEVQADSRRAKRPARKIDM